MSCDTCRVSSQQASGERHVSKKSFPALDSRNSEGEIQQCDALMSFVVKLWQSLMQNKKKRKEKTEALITAPGRYRPACLIHHTGTCSVSSPRAARRNVSFCSWGKSLGLERKKQNKNLALARVCSLRSWSKPASKVKMTPLLQRRRRRWS